MVLEHAIIVFAFANTFNICDNFDWLTISGFLKLGLVQFDLVVKLITNFIINFLSTFIFESELNSSLSVMSSFLLKS